MLLPVQVSSVPVEQSYSFVLNIPKHTLCVAINTEVPVSNSRYPIVSKEGQFFCGGLERRTLLTINLQHVY